MFQSIRNFPLRTFTNTLINFSEKMSEIKIVRKPRYNGSIKKRQWEERRTDKGEALDPVDSKKIKVNTEVTVTDELIEKIKRRKFAILMGYQGTNYYGMQRNPNMKTIEEDLFKAFLANQYITEENFAQVQTMQFQRAARTDKGVSAARQVVSLKLPENVDVAKINEHLPEVIRVFGVKRVTKGFNCKTNCDSRSYLYLLPTVSFIPAEQEMVQKGFRIDEITLNKVQELLQKYLGTKNFHNFTSKKKPNDPSAKRYMKNLVIEKPFVKDDVEFAVIKIQGQSFMLHQIRKMIGLLLAVVKGYTTMETIDNAFGENRVNVPRAPGLGLVLDYVHYDRYNIRYGTDGMHEKLVWDEVEEQVNDFKEKFIYPTIINTEIEEESMLNWIVRKLTRHTYDDVDENEADGEENQEEEKSDEEEKVTANKT